jgi:hypothetical protein
MRKRGGFQGAATVLLQAALAVGCLAGCGVATRPPDGILDLPHFANQAPSKGIKGSPAMTVSAETIWVQ